MNAEELKQRTRKFALRAMKLVDSLPKTISGRAIGNQFVRCSTSVGANYSIVCRARSKAEFIAKMGIVLEECDECLFWLQLVMESGLLPQNRVKLLFDEANELTAIFTKSDKTARSQRQQAQKTAGTK